MIPMEPEDALAFIADKVPTGSSWNTKQWISAGSQARVKAMWAARVENARFLERAKKMLEDFNKASRENVTAPDGRQETMLKVGSREDFVLQMREFMVKEGMLSERELDDIKKRADKDVTTLASRQRLNLIFDTNVRSAWGYGRWKDGIRPQVLKLFPAARFVRNPGSIEKRPIHAANENEVRLKTDVRFWADEMNSPEIGGFAVPWPPYGFNSNMTQEEVNRAEAIRLGLMVKGQTIVPPDEASKELTDDMQAGTESMSPEMQARLLDSLRVEQAKRDAAQSERERVRRIAEEARRGALERALRRAYGEAKERIQRLLNDSRRKIVSGASILFFAVGGAIIAREAAKVEKRIGELTKRENAGTITDQEREELAALVDSQS